MGRLQQTHWIPPPTSTRITFPALPNAGAAWCFFLMVEGGPQDSVQSQTGGKVSQITNTPLMLISRVRPTLARFSQRKITGARNRKRTAFLSSTDPPIGMRSHGSRIH
jgi:hypothetical protein